MKLAEQWDDASRKRKTEAQFLRVISDIHEQIHGSPLLNRSVREYASHWLGRIEKQVAHTTYRSYRSVVENLVSFLSDKAMQPLNYVTAAQITAWRDASAQKTSNRTASNKLKVARVFFQTAWRDNLITDNPAAKVQTLKSTGGKRRPFTFDELRAVLALASQEWRGMILCGLYVGQRLGDIATLRWEQVDLVSGEVTFLTGKTKRRVNVPLIKDGPIRNYFMSLPASDDNAAPVFPEACKIVEAQGRTGTLSNQFANLLARACLIPERTHKKGDSGKGRTSSRTASPLCFHCLRHSATSLLKNAGVSESVTRDIIGHESAEVSRHYTHIDDESKRAALSKLPDITRCSNP